MDDKTIPWGLEDFKNTLISVIKNSKAKNGTELMMELMPIHFAYAFGAGQSYYAEREREENDTDI